MMYEMVSIVSFLCQPSSSLQGNRAFYTPTRNTEAFTLLYFGRFQRDFFRSGPLITSFLAKMFELLIIQQPARVF